MLKGLNNSYILCLYWYFTFVSQARTLRLLAYVYLDYKPEENLQNALNAVSLANTVSLTLLFFYLHTIFSRIFRVKFRFIDW